MRVLKKGKFNGNVELECDGFEVTPKSGIPNFEATLKGKVVSDGEIRLSVKFDDKVKTVSIPVKVQKEEAPSETSLTLPSTSSPAFPITSLGIVSKSIPLSSTSILSKITESL